MNAEAPRIPGTEEQRGRYIPWLFVAGFAVVIAANVTMMTFAIDSFSGLETRDSFRRGVGYNDVLAVQDRQNALGWQVDLEFVSAGEAGDGARGRLLLSLADAEGQPLSGATVEARFVRPTHAGVDFDLPLPGIADGRYGAEVAVPLKGVWDVRLTISRDGQPYYSAERLFVK